LFLYFSIYRIGVLITALFLHTIKEFITGSIECAVVTEPIIYT